MSTQTNDHENVIVIEPNGLDKFFRFSERGTTVKSEIGAGIGAFFIAVCALLMNTQIIGQAYGNYAGSYLAVTLIAFLGTLLMGVVCNLPLVQSANMALSAVMISMLGTDTGLTYPNILAVTFVAAAVYLVIVLTPARKVFIDALPDGVKKALPVGIGLYVIYIGLKNAGFLNADGSLVAVSDLKILKTYYFWLMIGAVFLFVLLKGLKRKKPAFVTFGVLVGAMWIGGILFFMDHFIGGQTAAVIVYERLNLVFATDGASPYSLPFAIKSLHVGELFTKGFDFSAYTAAGGNTLLLFLKGVMVFLFMGMYANYGNTTAAAVVGKYEDAQYTSSGEKKALVIGACLNVVSPILGGSPTSVGTQSAVGTHDGAKTGFSSLVASVGYLIAMFSWVFFMLFATSTNGVGMWINETEIKLAAYVQDTFAFADLIMILVGASMLRGIGRCDVSKLDELVPFAAAVIGTAFLQDISLGVAFGTVSYTICKLAGGEWKNLNIPGIILSAVMLVYLILVFL